ncbi:MAG: peptidoglycan-binding domain-containing protein [Bacteroidota bacterium]
MRLSLIALGWALLSLPSLAVAQTQIPPPALPPNGEEGKCYAICVIPDQTENYTETIEESPARTTTLVAVPEYETVRMRVAVKPAFVKGVYVPAEYETVTERIEIKPARTRYEVIPAQYEEREERIMVAEGSTEYETLPATFETVTNAKLYYGDTEGSSKDYGNLLDPNNPYNPNKPDSPFNPNKPDSPFNPNNPNSPFNPASPYSFENPDNLFNPSNPNSPYNAAYVSGRSADEVQNASNDLITKAGTGTILPYVTKEATVKLDRIPREYETISEEVEVSPASKTYVKAPGNCKDNPNCITWCEVEVPAQYQTVNRRVAKACAAGYTAGTTETGGDDYCVRLTYVPAEYGPRTIMTAGPRVREKAVDARFITVKKTVLVKAAEVKEITEEAEFREVERRVVKRAAYTRQEVVPAEYETITRRVRKGLGNAQYIDPTGTLLLPSEYSAAGNLVPGTFPAVINPATGYALPDATVAGDYGAGRPKTGLLTPGSPGTLHAGDAPGGLPDNYYTAGCPSGYRFDPLDNTCKKTMEIPAVTSTVTKTRVTKAGGFSEWKEVLCPNEATSATIRQIQQALANRGYDPGPVDNVMGAKTKAALTKFQRDNGLPVGGLNLDTLRKLGLR